MIRIENLHIDLLDFHLEDIHLNIEENEFFILMGPTGAGKTVLLEAIAGLVPVKNGKIFVSGRDVTALPPEKRGIGIVYQDHSLFPHMTVLENIIYGLHFHKVEKRRAATRLDELLEGLNLFSLKGRLPLNLSGGELQRVALARALMVEPEVLLLDEPLSALDPGFREDIRRMLRKLHRSSKTTFLMVTHDFAEALSVGGRGAVLNNGRIEQIGTLEDIFQRPRTTFVADFVGIKNLFQVKFEGSKAVFEDLSIELGRESENGSGFLAIRPEDIVISKKPFQSSIRNSFQGEVVRILDQGFFYEIKIVKAKVSFKSLITKRSLVELGIREGSNVFFSFKSTAVHTF